MKQVVAARGWRSARGFSLIDLMITVGLVATIAAIAVPQMTSTIDGLRLGIDARSVERELQLARLAAVTTNRPIRVRFNCPTAGSYRRVELIGNINSANSGSDADNQAATRCNTLNYPFPAGDNDPLTRPNNDGPVMRLNSKVSFTSTQTIEFWPNGTVRVYNATTVPWPQIGDTPVNIILSKGSTTRAITVNGLGKTQIQ
jgi:Tfp pilus assembly protein FimT